jgi:hypothetical protein
MRSVTSRRTIVSFAVLAAIVVVAGFLALQLAPRAAAPAVVASPSPRAVDYGPPPSNVPLLWVQDPNHDGWLIGFDWTGKPRGTVKLSQPMGEHDKLSQAPDGSAFGIEASGKGGFRVYLDRLGNVSPSPSSVINYPLEMWADDSRHVCTLSGLGGHWNLGLMVPGGAQNPVNVVAIDPTLARSGIIAFSFAACSALNDRAVIQYSYFGRPTEYFVVRISDGAILQQRIYATDQVANVTASMDGSLIAENSGKSTGQAMPAAASTIIRRAADMSVVTTLDSSTGVLAFSGDDSSVLVNSSPWTAGVPTMLEVLDLQTGAVMWRGEGTAALSTFAVQPAGNAFAVALTQPGSQAPPATILIVYGDGSRPAKLPGLFVPSW